MKKVIKLSKACALVMSILMAVQIFFGQMLEAISVASELMISLAFAAVNAVDYTAATTVIGDYIVPLIGYIHI